MAVRIQDGNGNPLTSTTNALDVNVKSSGISQPIIGAVSQVGDTISANGTPVAV